MSLAPLAARTDMDWVSFGIGVAVSVIVVGVVATFCAYKCGEEFRF